MTSQDLTCPICFCIEHELDLEAIIEGAVEQWAAWKTHEQHTTGEMDLKEGLE